MARYKKKDYLAVVELLEQVNRRLSQCDLHRVDAPAIFSDCQEAAITLGMNLEQQGEEGIRLTNILEEYCENLYQLSQKLVEGADNKVCAGYIQTMARQLAELEEGICKRLPERKEVVFLPYKASMWDSLESVWMAADKDPNCDAYVIPIPYYDKKPDGSIGKLHYEGGLYPDYVSVTDYREYDLEESHPDIIFIHNPYDQYNNATSIAPEYYSDKLKQCTKCLVYIPYYATAGGMGMGQSLCPVYFNADYIVMQSANYRKCFDPRIPDKKFLPLGSPKFDKVIRLCSNPPEAPTEWQEKMKGKKVYFYNTSLAGMLADTKSFLCKMEYIFQCFEGRKDSCLLWRPHPLLETTIDSMRQAYRPYFNQLKQYFLQNQLGIYDDTSDIEKTIALCDAYIGDGNTSVTTLFGVVGKPMFILNNGINAVPQTNDWRGEIIKDFFIDGQDDWMITQGNQLYCAPKHDYVYEYYCDLSSYSGGAYYKRVIEIAGKIYVCPQNAQNILVIEHNQIIKRIDLKNEANRPGAFSTALIADGYLYLLPFYYSAIVRYDTKGGQVDYIEGYQKYFVKNVRGEWRIGGSCVWRKYIMIASPDKNEVLAIDSASMQVSVIEIRTSNVSGYMVMVPEGDEIWLLPYDGKVIIRWNPTTGMITEYNQFPENFQCTNRPHGYVCMERPFSGMAFSQELVIVSPYWGNMFLSINKKTGEVKEWKPPFSITYELRNGYWNSGYAGKFLRKTDSLGEGSFRFFNYAERELFDVNIRTGEYREIPIIFQEEELRKHAAGFSEVSDWLPYGCMENAFCTLNDFLNDELCGDPFDKNRQIAAHKKITQNMDGTSGEKIYQIVCQKSRSGDIV